MSRVGQTFLWATYQCLVIGGVSPRMWVIFLHDDGAVNGPHPRDEVLLRAWERQGRLLARG